MSSPFGTSEYQRERILVTVKTYPVPHEVHGEAVCTAGITQSGEWRRLWPVPFRFLDRERQFHRYEWVEVELRPRRSDLRKESRVINQETLRPTGDVVSTSSEWRARRALILPYASRSIEELREGLARDRTSMGIIRPKEIRSLTLSMLTGPRWSATQRLAASQPSLLAAATRPLQELPFRLRLAFRCDDARCRGHVMNITDWEVGGLYFRFLRQGRDPESAAQAVHHRFSRLFSDAHDSWLYVGTMGPVRPNFIVTGIFYPPAPTRPTLFDSLP